MARPAEFDREDALVAAMQLFWRQGYGSTSLSQLLEAMGIGRSSFYAAFGDKRSLYIEALALFARRTIAILRDHTDMPPAQRIHRFFTATLFEVPRHRAQRGCMMVNTVLELADVDDDLCAMATAHLQHMETGFKRLLSADGNSALPAADGARYLMMINQGLRVAARQGRSRRELATMVDDALALLGLVVSA